MRLYKSLKHAFGMVLHSRLRSWLTIIGIVIGVASVIAIMALGNGLEAAISAQFAGRGVDLLTITAGAPRGGGFGGFGGGGGGGAAASSNNKTPELTRSDVQSLKGINLIGDIDTQINGQVTIYYLGQSGKIGINGVNQDVWAKMTNPVLQAGRPIGPSDSNVVVIGGRLASTYFKSPIGINKGIVLGGRAFRVVGIMNDSSTSVYMPIQQAYPLLSADHSQDTYDRIVVQVRDVAQVTNASTAITQLLSLRRHVTTKPDFSVSDPSAQLATRQATVASLTGFLTAIAAVALIVGAVGIANTMFTSVLERTKQIGIMKAIGATRGDILALFLLNAALIGLIGGIIGAIFGYILAQAMPSLLSFGPGGGNTVAIVDARTVAFAIGISVAIGVIAGLIPAWSGSKLKPVDALRYE